MSSLIWFIAIIALIPLALWLLKRTPMGGGAGHGQLRSIAALPLSTNQRIVTVEVGQGEARRWLVLGVTAQSITTLHTMIPDPVPESSVRAELVEAPGSSASTGSARTGAGFAHLLNKLRQDRGNDGR
jgi:flagellar protein FliO/FliZ